MKAFLNISVAAVAILGLAACATKSNVKADGTTDNPVFPEPYSLTFILTKPQNNTSNLLRLYQTLTNDF